MPKTNQSTSSQPSQQNDQSSKATILKKAIDDINNTYGLGSVWSAMETEIPQVEVVSTNALTLDKALGVGGIPRGRITEIYGPESVGKTTLALSVVANVQATGGTAAIIDVEHALDLAYAKTIGVKIEDLLVSQPDSGEQALEIAESLVRAGIDCVVLDSVAMIVTEAEIRGEMTDFQVGAQARLMGKALRKLMAPIDKANCVFILINQIREKVGVIYGSPETTPGGRAIKYMASVRIDLRRKEQIKDGENHVGIRVTAKVVKNKVAAPAKQAEFSILFNKGIDHLESLVEVGVDLGVLTRSGAWFSFGEERLGQGMIKTKEFLKDNPEVLERIWKSIEKN